MNSKSRQALTRPSMAPDETVGWSLRTDGVIVVLLAMAGVGSALLLFRSLPVASDQMIYFTAAESPGSSAPSHHSTRAALIIPTSIAQLVFGYSEAAYYTAPALTGALLVVASYVLARSVTGEHRHSRLIGVLAAIPVAFNPLVLDYMTQLLTDVGATALLTLGLAFIILHARYASEDVRTWYLVAAGACFAGAFLFRESVVLFTPAVILVALVLGMHWRHLSNLWGAAVVIAIEAVWSLYLWGEPLARLNAILSRSSRFPTERELSMWEAVLSDQRDVGKALGMFPDILVEHSGAWVGGLLLLGIALTAGVAIFRRERLIRAVLVWVVGLWAGLLISGAFAIGEGPPILRLFIPRYWLPLIPPIVVGLTASLYHLVSSRRSERGFTRSISWVAPIILIGGLATFSIDATATGPGLVAAWEADRFAEFRSWLASGTTDKDLILSDERSADILRMYTVGTFGTPIWDGRVHGYPVTDTVPDPPHGDVLLVLNKPSIWRAQRASSNERAPWTMSPPEEFLIWHISSDGNLLAMSGDTDAHRVGWPGESWMVEQDDDDPDPYIQGVRGEIELEDDVSVVIRPVSTEILLMDKHEMIDVGTDVTIGGSVIYRLHCSFDDLAGMRRSVAAIPITWFELPTGRVRSICPIPSEFSPPMSFAPIIRAEGPGTIHVESGWAQVSITRE